MVYKKLVSMAAVSAMALSVLTACGTGDDSETASTAAATAASTEAAADEQKDTAQAVTSSNADLSSKKIGVSIYQFSDDFMTLYRSELSSYLESLGFSTDNIEIVDAADDVATQKSQIQNFISNEVDVLVINPVDPADIADVTDLAVAADIPVIYINRETTEEEKARWQDGGWDVTYVGSDPTAAGTMQGEIIAALDNQGDLNGDGKVSYYMIEGDAENIDAAMRTTYSVQALETAGIGTECLGSASGDWERAEGREIAEAALAEYGSSLEVMLCNNDAMALGALEAIQAAGRTVGKDIYLVGVDGLKEACEDIIAGTMTGTVYNDYVAQSHAAADAAVSYITGAGNEHTISCDYFKVTTQNAQDVLDSLK